MKMCIFTIVIANKMYVVHEKFHSLNVVQTIQKVGHPWFIQT